MKMMVVFALKASASRQGIHYIFSRLLQLPQIEKLLKIGQ